MSAWLQTYTGNKFYPSIPQPGDIYIEDIAHALSNICRFAGHCNEYYSVAQHSVHVWEIVNKLPNVTLDEEKWALAHDFGEAYVGDLPTPIKREMPVFGEIEDEILKAVALKWDLSWPMSSRVKHADLVMLATEKQCLMTREPAPWGPLPGPLPMVIAPLTPKQAKGKLLRVFDELFK